MQAVMILIQPNTKILKPESQAKAKVRMMKMIKKMVKSMNRAKTMIFAKTTKVFQTKAKGLTTKKVMGKENSIFELVDKNSCYI